MLTSRIAAIGAVVTVVIAACGGKTTDLDAGPNEPGPDAAPDVAPDNAPPTTIDAGGRICPPECAVGHQCCKGSCGGIPAAMPSDCCSCLPGEIDSNQCSNGKCGP